MTSTRSNSNPVSVAFDDLIFALQPFGGASVYWEEVTSRVSRDSRCRVSRTSPARWKRGLPASSRADVFHSSHFRVCAAGGARNVSTVHDLNYELGLVPASLGSRVNLLERKASYFTAAALICISENTKKDLLEVYPGLRQRCPIHVIHHGVSVPVELPSGAAETKPEAPFLLYVGGRKAYKNFATALTGYVASGVWRDGVRLLCTGAPFDEAERKQVHGLGVETVVEVVGRCSQEQLFALYRHAHCLLYTSTYEGFGLPPLEAMASGCPVIACRASSIPEVTGDAAVLVTPTAADEVARAILELQDRHVRAALVEKGKRWVKRFSWDESARKHADVYVSVARGARTVSQE
jgi:glycosyltransferase involved in cell wall biosynthesis